MLNPVEKTVAVTLPTSVLTMAEFPRISSLDELIKDMFEEIQSESDSADFLEEAYGNPSGLIFLPLVIDNMICYDLDFESAFERAKPEIQKTAAETEMQFKFMKMMGLSEMIMGLIKEMIKPLIDVAQEKGSDEISEGFAVSITITPQTAFGLRCANVLDIAEKILENQELMDEVRNKAIYPFIEGALQALGDKESIQDNKKELVTLVTETTEDASVSLVLKALLSEILTKAINENISFIKAAEAYSSEELSSIALKSLSNTKDLRKYVEAIKKSLKVLGKLE